MHTAGVHADETNRHCAFCLSGIVSLTFARFAVPANFVGNLSLTAVAVHRTTRRSEKKKKCTMLGLIYLFIDIATSLVLDGSPTNQRFLSTFEDEGSVYRVEVRSY